MGKGGRFMASGLSSAGVCFPVVCGVLWWLYHDYTNDLSVELDNERENMQCVLGFALVSTVFTVRNAPSSSSSSGRC